MIYINYTLSLNTFGLHFLRWGLQQAETAMLQRLREDLPRLSGALHRGGA